MLKKLDTIKKGFRVVDEDNNPYTVVKVFYKKEYIQNLLIPIAVVLRNDRIKSTKKMSVFELHSNYKVFNAYAIKEKLAKKNKWGSAKVKTPSEVAARVTRTVNQAFDDPVNKKRSDMQVITKAITRQIFAEHNIVRQSKTSDVTLIYNAIQKSPNGLFHGFIAKSGFWSRMVAHVIITIDWMGSSEKFQDYKKEVFEEFPSHSVIVINTQDKKKAFVIGLLERIILKYPKSQGGK